MPLFPTLRSKACISLFHVYLKLLEQLPLYSLLTLKTIKSNFIHLYSLSGCSRRAATIVCLCLLSNLSLCPAGALSTSKHKLFVLVPNCRKKSPSGLGKNCGLLSSYFSSTLNLKSWFLSISLGNLQLIFKSELQIGTR